MSRELKDPLYEQFARVGKVMGSPKRLELLDLMLKGERSVEELAALTGMGVANTSAHLQMLRQARLVETRKVGTRVFYRLANDEVAGLLIALQETARSRLAASKSLCRGKGKGKARRWTSRPGSRAASQASASSRTSGRGSG